jgi:heme exporter protein D
MTEFLQMGGYAMFVWPSYALAAAVLWLNWYLPRNRHNRELRLLKRRLKAEQK